jgi:hypothetical protein
MLHSESSCFGKNTSNPDVCSGRGICFDNNKCSCEPGYTGDNCQYNICFDVSSADSKVCSGRGSCIAPNICTCRVGSSGENCQSYVCFGINSTDANVCSSVGACVNIDQCSCSFRQLGYNCQYNIRNSLLQLIFQKITKFIHNPTQYSQIKPEITH